MGAVPFMLRNFTGIIADPHESAAERERAPPALIGGKRGV